MYYMHKSLLLQTRSTNKHFYNTHIIRERIPKNQSLQYDTVFTSNIFGKHQEILVSVKIMGIDKMEKHYHY